MTTAPSQQRGALRLGLIAVIIVCVVGAFAVAPGAVVAQDDGRPPVPAAYYGTVTIDGDPAPEGVEITAELEGETYGPIETDESGAFGGELVNQSKLTVDPNSTPDDPTVTFFVDGEEAAETSEWESGASKEVTLSIDTGGDQSGGTGGGGSGGGGGDGGGDDGGDDSGDDGSATDTDDTNDTDVNGTDDTGETATGTNDTDTDSDSSETTTDDDTTTSSADDDTTDDGAPGFGVGSVLGALIAVVLSVRLRQVINK